MTTRRDILQRFIDERATKVRRVDDQPGRPKWRTKDQQAYDRLEHVWQELDVAKDAALQHLDRLDQKENMRQREQGQREQRRFVRRWATTGLAVMVLLAIGFIGYYPFDAGETYQTVTGEQKVVYLKDGSKLHLNTRTTAQVNYSGESRVVELQQGEAIFDVTQDVERPFIVHANGKSVRVIGTRFNVLIGAGKTVVTVEQGAVSFDSNEPDSDQEGKGRRATMLKAGQQLAYTSAGTPGEVKTVDPLRITAWQKGRLIYDRMPLEQVVADLNRYYPGEIKIKDAELKSLLVSGVYYISDRVSTVRALSHFLPINYEVVSQQVMVLEKK